MSDDGGRLLRCIEGFFALCRPGQRGSDEKVRMTANLVQPWLGVMGC
jgi:hypothetical protein